MRLRAAKERYKIKPRNAGCRLVHQVKEQQLPVLVVAVGKGEGNDVDKAGERRKTD
jgi:mRNA interferase RelE/StbE